MSSHDVCFLTRSDRHLRIWPAGMVTLVHWVAGLLFSRWGQTDIQNAVAVGALPLGYFLLMLVWWLLLSRVPVRERLLGLVLLLGALAAPMLLQSSVGMGALLMTATIPVVMNGLVVLLLLFYPLRWTSKRWVLVLYILGCAVVFCLYRVDTIGGNFAPIIHWRWSPTLTSHSEALPLLQKQGQARLSFADAASDWPAFRGPLRDGVVTGVRFDTDWSVPPPQLWRIDIGPAWSSFIIVDNYLFTQEQRGPHELVTCYAANTGSPVWQNTIKTQFDDAMGVGPRATPSFSEGYLYTQGGTGILQCLDATTGQSVWTRNVVNDAESAIPDFGFSSSPLVLGDLLIVFTGGSEGKSLIAYDRQTGSIVWKSGPNTTGYSSPHHAYIQGCPQVLMVSDYGIQAFNIPDGRLLWEDKWVIDAYNRCTQPAMSRDSDTFVLFGGTATSGTRRLRIIREGDAWRAEEEWTTRQFRPHFNDGVLHKGHYYGFDGKRIVCLDIESGTRQWAGERHGGQMLLVADMDMLLILSESGVVLLVAAVPDGFKEIGRFQALHGKTWNHPVVAGDRLFVRNAREAACFALSEGAPP